ncbi:peptidylprolyl isomerase [Brunnivagina elsteri]|uniref:Peptidyl-prolyl cis-trans isomerase n=1 Tax=Brunnivagina elsteri CCALA 953 TaxID=987040 RepID=A0A2A2TA60_9CYAN|nr:peptidylprolyl isomerase [Calothrix elsteri]PAX45776.1 peptidylprolyl isomerase [Calothrix elsteri CCALA 953]
MLKYPNKSGLIPIATFFTLFTLATATYYSWTQQPVSAGKTMHLAQKTAPIDIKKLPQLVGKATVVMIVNKAPITIEVDGTNAPISAGNFVDLVQRKAYDGLAFHRVVREPEPFVVQGGDPQSKDPKIPAEAWGTGGWIDPDTGKIRYVPLEIKLRGGKQPIYGKVLEDGKIPVLKHRRGAVAMARANEANSASSQFYFALSDLGFLDGKYAVFGYVTKGMDVVDKIKQSDRIQSARVVKGLNNLKK